MKHTTAHRVLVAMNLPTHVPDVIKKGRTIVTAMTGNANFTTPTPTLPTVTTALDGLDQAEHAAATKAKGTAKARDVALGQVKLLLRHLVGFVQQIADTDPDHAAAIIQSAGLDVRKLNPRQKQVFHAVQSVSGSVTLFAEVALLASAYDWQISTDGKTWTSLPTTTKAKADVHGLNPGATYSFRVMPVLRKGDAEWSQVVSMLVK
jgi:hypothetical protein